MSNTGRLTQADVAALNDILDPKWLLRHRHSPAAFMVGVRRRAARAARKKLPGLRAIAPYLFDYLSDEKTIFTALRHMAAEGSHAPGPGGVRYEDIVAAGEWKFCRGIHHSIREGEWGPGEEWLVKIPKGPGRGFRELVVQGVDDRVVHRAVVEVLQPLFDPLFDPRSFGYRPKKGPLRALATAERLYQELGLGVWVSADIRNAFPSVPVGRLLGVLRKYLPADDLLAFLETVTAPVTTPGLRQGSPLSPLLLNLYLHHVLDREWRKRHPDIPLLRFADDILLLCRNLKEARSAYRALAALLTPAGFTLKEDEAAAIRRVAAGETVSWMGFGIGGAADGLCVTVTEHGWDSLAEKLAAAHSRPNSPVVAVASLMAWVRDKAPCFPYTDAARAYSRMCRLATAQGFEEIPSDYEVKAAWQQAYARWCKLRAGVAVAGEEANGGEQ